MSVPPRVIERHMQATRQLNVSPGVIREVADALARAPLTYVDFDCVEITTRADRMHATLTASPAGLTLEAWRGDEFLMEVSSCDGDKMPLSVRKILQAVTPKLIASGALTERYWLHQKLGVDFGALFRDDAVTWSDGSAISLDQVRDFTRLVSQASVHMDGDVITIDAAQADRNLSVAASRRSRTSRRITVELVDSSEPQVRRLRAAGETLPSALRLPTVAGLNLAAARKRGSRLSVRTF